VHRIKSCCSYPVSENMMLAFVGASDFAVCAMTAFSAEDLSGEQFGASFVLTAIGGFVAFIQHFVIASSSGYSQVSQPGASTDAGNDTRQSNIAQSHA